MLSTRRIRIEAGFAALGLRAKLQPMPFPDYAESDESLSVNVVEDRHGAYIDVRYHPHWPPDVAVVRLTKRALAIDASDETGNVTRYVCSREPDGWRVHRVGAPRAPV